MDHDTRGTRGSAAGREALDRLLAGNARFVASRMEHPNCSPGRRAQLLAGQKPFAAVLGCADSRIPPEVVFDQGLGDLFVIRVAGNVATDHIIASIEYAVAHLNVPLMMVLGHSCCGAVTATLQGHTTEGHLPELAALIEPACRDAQKTPGDPIDRAARLLARQTAIRLQEESAIIAAAVAAERVRLVAAYYDLESGRVEVL